MRIDLNSDVGESFGAYTIGQDPVLLPHITSANVACGFHAGDPCVMRATVALAREHGVAIGARIELVEALTRADVPAGPVNSTRRASPT